MEDQAFGGISGGKVLFAVLWRTGVYKLSYVHIPSSFSLFCLTDGDHTGEPEAWLRFRPTRVLHLYIYSSSKQIAVLMPKFPYNITNTCHTLDLLHHHGNTCFEVELWVQRDIKIFHMFSSWYWSPIFIVNKWAGLPFKYFVNFFALLGV